MYPRVKVRGHEEYDDQFEFEKRSLQSLKVPEFLSSNDFSSPDNSPTSVVRVPQVDSSDPVQTFCSSCIDYVCPRCGSEGAASNRKQKILEENSTNIRFSPVLRPRAVLSSPDNDQIVGSKNKTREESLSSSRKNSSFPNRHTKVKVIPQLIAVDGPVDTRRELKEVAASRNALQSRQGTVTTDPSLKANLRKGNLKPFPDRALSNSPMRKR